VELGSDGLGLDDAVAAVVALGAGGIATALTAEGLAPDEHGHPCEVSGADVLPRYGAHGDALGGDGLKGHVVRNAQLALEGLVVEVVRDAREEGDGGAIERGGDEVFRLREDDAGGVRGDVDGGAGLRIGQRGAKVAGVGGECVEVIGRAGSEAGAASEPWAVFV
jgi:hypothetical protein